MAVSFSLPYSTNLQVQVNKYIKNYTPCMQRLTNQYTENSIFYLRFEQLTPLSTHLQQTNTSEQQIKYIFVQIILALQNLHLNNIVHHNLSIINIFVDNEIIKLGQYLVPVQSIIPPERLKNGLSVENDVYSAGMILCFILNGSYIKGLNDFSVELNRIQKQMTSINPKMRPKLRQVLDCGIFDTEITRFNTNLAINGYFDAVSQNQKIMNAELGSVDTDLQIKNGINDEILAHRFATLKESVGDTHVLKEVAEFFTKGRPISKTQLHKMLGSKELFNSYFDRAVEIAKAQK
ncbi:Kinase [Hexamita inflata]|uniref:non-specific serine/threonine protein kinase n=1 Tax=Hexamita inflata TaxID=28002 RepID=A0AA86QQP4_9EUKA|nr:Kinase [Hexamita inflata]